MVDGIVNGMKLKIDGAGRIVVPKRVRDRFGFRAGMEVDMVESAEGVLLRPMERRPTLVREGVLLVHTGAVAPGYDLRRAVEDERDERVREIWGR
jgi:AbrB family looped-hinge helix DNA binding protein